MSRQGWAHGAATVVNAMATGHGAAFGLQWPVTVTIEQTHTTTVTSNGRTLKAPEDALVLACLRLSPVDSPVRVDVATDIPPCKGLKTSSAVAVAALRALFAHANEKVSDEQLLRLAAEAGLESQTSRTGAYDDAAACLLGGLVLTDNTARKILERRRLPDDLVALVHVPEGEVATQGVRELDLVAAREQAAQAFEHARAGRIGAAMKANTHAYAPRFGVDISFSQAAWSLDAWAAGLSGTGPAQVALVPSAKVHAFDSLPPFQIRQLRHGGPA